MIVVVSWNVLAPAYALPQRYAEVPVSDLASATRLPRLHAQLDALLTECDVVALQEVDADLVAWLGVSGDGATHVLHEQRPRAPDGVALASRRHAMTDPTSGVSSDRRRAWCAATVNGVRVVSMHLDWAPGTAAPHRGATQAAELVDWLSRDPGVQAGTPVAVAGDLNAGWGSAPGAVLRASGLEPLDDMTRSTAVVDGHTVELDVVAVRNLTGDLHLLRDLPVPGRPDRLPDEATPSDHVPIRAVLRHPDE